jgi:hypothetical protein
MSARYYVVVFGPNATGFNGTDMYDIERPDAVQWGERDELIITTAPREERVHPRLVRIKARGPQTVVYPRGEWTKIKVGERPKRREPALSTFEVDLDGTLTRPNWVWTESWTDLLSAISIARCTGSQGTRVETNVEGRGRQVFKATRRQTIHDGTQLRQAVYDIEQEV